MSEGRTAVIFRKCKGDGEIIALFPEIRSDGSGCHCLSYGHIGQHGGANYRLVLQATIPATLRDSEPLAKELTAIGYAWKVCHRETNRHRTRRMTATKVLLPKEKV